MVKSNPTFGSSRTKKGFAIFPVMAGDYTIQFQSYEVVQNYNPLTKEWENDYFTLETFGDWRKI